ncbi:MAG: phosphatase PAP2-related protein [Candidatus Pacebacteria bacterium]|nr:phosphatase PAP2-related protein [Candidatus Paceibacterota bacterium]
MFQKNKFYFTQKSFLLACATSVAFLALSMFVNFYAGMYATEIASNPVTDIVLSNTPVFNVDGIFTYGPLILWLFVAYICIVEPNRIPFVLKSVALFTVIRSVFITLTHMGPFPRTVAFNPDVFFFRNFTFGADLFFSGHVGLPFLLALMFWNNKELRYVFIASSFIFAVVVLLGHLHYSIDVLSAFFITYTIFHMAKKFFPKDYNLFSNGL